MAQKMQQPHNVLGENTSTNTHVILSVFMFVLATPACNPVLLFCETLSIPRSVISCIAVFFFCQTIFTDFSNVVYFGLRIFCHSILSIFFRSITVIGMENIPAEGPVIFTGNHANQFVDGLQVLCHARHRVSFIIAETSWNKPIIGHMAKLLKCIPVARPQDAAKKGEGQVVFDGTRTVVGVGTHFTQCFEKGSKIRKRGDSNVYKVIAVESDEVLVLCENIPVPNLPKEDAPCDFDCLPKGSADAMYDQVFAHLAKGGCLGIFPEGGSHDRTDLLPLKPGVALIALGFADKYKAQVPIIPVGLSYFEGHRFRGRCVIEFGPPIFVDAQLAKEYHVDKRQACTQFLEQVEDGIRCCLCTAPSFDELRLVHMCRKLYWKGPAACTDTALMQNLSRRFAFWYNNVYMRWKKAGQVPDELEVLLKEIQSYMYHLRLLGLQDHQVQQLSKPVGLPEFGKFMHMLTVWLLASIPSVVLNFPVGIYARATANRHMGEALAKSTVKIEAKDVRLSKMIVTCIAGVPLLWVCYAIIICFFGARISQVILFLVACPVFSYLGVIAAEAGMVDLRDLKPILLRITLNHKEMKQLIIERDGLATQVRAMVKKYGPSLGEVYRGRNVGWSQFKDSSVNLADMEIERGSSESQQDS